MPTDSSSPRQVMWKRCCSSVCKGVEKTTTTMNTFLNGLRSVATASIAGSLLAAGSFFARSPPAKGSISWLQLQHRLHGQNQLLLIKEENSQALRGLFYCLQVHSWCSYIRSKEETVQLSLLSSASQTCSPERRASRLKPLRVRLRLVFSIAFFSLIN